MAFCQHFQFHGRLPLKIYPLANADYRRHGVKQASQAGCLRAVDAFFHHFDDDVDFLGLDLPEQRQIQLRQVFPEGCMQVTERHAPGLLYGGAAARHRHLGQMGNPFKLCGLGHQHLAAPDGAVRAVTGTVKGQPNDRAFQFVLGHAADDVRMMMLDFDDRDLVLFLGIARAQIVRMHIAGDAFGPDFKNAFQMRHSQFKKIQGDQVFKITDMLA